MPKTEILLEIPIEDSEPFGVTLNDKLVVTNIQTGTVAEDKLEVGDQIVDLNGTQVRSQKHFEKLLRLSSPIARITIIREEEKSDKCAVPSERMKLVQRREGFEYLVATLEWRPGGPKFGLGIRHHLSRVLVTRCDPGSLAATQLKVGDRIVDVESKPVSGKDVARGILLKALQSNGVASMLIERPQSTQAQEWTQHSIHSSAGPAPPSVVMNSDVKAIASREREKLKQRASHPPKKGILGGSAESGAEKRHVVIKEKVGSHIIGSDTEGKNLRHVNK